MLCRVCGSCPILSSLPICHQATSWCSSKYLLYHCFEIYISMEVKLIVSLLHNPIYIYFGKKMFKNQEKKNLPTHLKIKLQHIIVLNLLKYIYIYIYIYINKTNVQLFYQIICVHLTKTKFNHRAPLVQWSLHKYKCSWSVGGKGRSSSIQEGVSHTYILRLSQSSNSILYKKKKNKNKKKTKNKKQNLKDRGRCKEREKKTN